MTLTIERTNVSLARLRVVSGSTMDDKNNPV